MKYLEWNRFPIKVDGDFSTDSNIVDGDVITVEERRRGGATFVEIYHFFFPDEDFRNEEEGIREILLTIQDWSQTDFKNWQKGNGILIPAPSLGQLILLFGDRFLRVTGKYWPKPWSNTRVEGPFKVLFQKSGGLSESGKIKRSYDKVKLCMKYESKTAEIEVTRGHFAEEIDNNNDT
jgi:hypothetical protein